MPGYQKTISPPPTNLDSITRKGWRTMFLLTQQNDGSKEKLSYRKKKKTTEKSMFSSNLGCGLLQKLATASITCLRIPAMTILHIHTDSKTSGLKPVTEIPMLRASNIGWAPI